MKGNIWTRLPHGFTVLAPMEGVTDVVFRQVIAEAGRPDLFFTEFTNVSSFASPKGRFNALERFQIAPTDAPIVAQIWGKNPEHFREVASALEGLGFDGIDINMGCPDRHVNATGGGAAMIRTPDLAIECLRQAKSTTNLPVSVKTRLGYTAIDEFRDWLPILLRENLAALTVHLRTRKEMSKVPAHFELIPEIVTLRNQLAPDTKLVINGDVKDLQMTRELAAQYPEVDGYMVGRGVFENPYCFTEHQPNQAELLTLLLRHLDYFDAEDARYVERQIEAIHDDAELALKLDGKVRGLPFDPLKHYFKIYVRDFPGAAELRAAMMNCQNTAEIRMLVERRQQ